MVFMLRTSTCEFPPQVRLYDGEGTQLIEAHFEDGNPNKAAQWKLHGKQVQLKITGANPGWLSLNVHEDDTQAHAGLQDAHEDLLLALESASIEDRASLHNA